MCCLIWGRVFEVFPVCTYITRNKLGTYWCLQYVNTKYVLHLSWRQFPPNRSLMPSTIISPPLTYLDDFALVNHSSFPLSGGKRSGETATVFSRGQEACKSRWKIIGWRLGDRREGCVLSRKCYICAMRCSFILPREFGCLIDEAAAVAPLARTSVQITRYTAPV